MLWLSDTFETSKIIYRSNLIEESNMTKRKLDDGGHNIEDALKEAHYVVDMKHRDWQTASDLALAGEFFEYYHLLPEEYIKKYERKNQL